MDKDQIQKIRQKYLAQPPDGMTKKQVQKMSDNHLLDLDYFLNEHLDDFDDDAHGMPFDLSHLCPKCQKILLDKFGKS